LNHGKHVITANKAVIAIYLKEFTEAAERHNVKFYFEASVGGGIPWIQGLEKALRIDNVNSISGIFNGTSNFILDQMSRNGESFIDVLKKAQQLHFYCLSLITLCCTGGNTSRSTHFCRWF